MPLCVPRFLGVEPFNDFDWLVSSLQIHQIDMMQCVGVLILNDIAHLPVTLVILESFDV